MKPWAWQMVNLFRLFQGGMGGGAILPSAAMAEPVVMMEAFTLMSDFDARLREKDGALLNEDDKIDQKAQEEAESRAMNSWLGFTA